MSTRSPTLNRLVLLTALIENFWLMYGRRPYAAFGNSSNDDQQVLEYVKSGTGARLSVVVMHDDAEREYAYDRQSHFGRLDTALDAAAVNGWTVVSMKDDWAEIFPTSIGRAIK